MSRQYTLRNECFQASSAVKAIATGSGFERLQRLSAFATLQKDLGDALKERGW